MTPNESRLPTKQPGHEDCPTLYYIDPRTREEIPLKCGHRHIEAISSHTMYCHCCGTLMEDEL